jgi:hypothetical protein
MAKGGIDRLESSDPDPRAQICPSLWVNQHAMWTIGFNIKGRDLMCVRSVLTPASVIQQSSITCLEPVALTRSTPFLTDLTVQAASNQDRWSQDQRPTPSLPHAATRRRRLHRATAGAIAGRPLIPHSDAFSSINWVLHVEEEMTNTMGGSLPVFAQQSWLPTVYADPRWINVVGEKFPRRGPKFTSGAASTTPTTSLGKPQGTTAGPQLQARWSSPKAVPHLLSGNKPCSSQAAQSKVWVPKVLMYERWAQFYTQGWVWVQRIPVWLREREDFVGVCAGSVACRREIDMIGRTHMSARRNTPRRARGTGGISGLAG